MYTKLCPKSNTKPYPETEIGARHVASPGTELAWNVQGQTFNNKKQKTKHLKKKKKKTTKARRLMLQKASGVEGTGV